MATNQVWQHRTNGEQYVVTVDDEGNAIAASGALHHSEIKRELLGEYETEAAYAEDFQGERASEYRVLSDADIAAIEEQ